MNQRVYVMECDGFVKIGVSGNVERRAKQIPYKVRRIYEEDDYASGMMNGPSFADSQKGDSVTVEVTEKYVNGKLVDRYISGIE